MKFPRCFWLALGLTLAVPRHAVRAAPTFQTSPYYAHLYLLSQEEDPAGKYFVIWRGKPLKLDLRAMVDSEYSCPSNTDKGINGVSVRVKAFDSGGKPSGQINGPGPGDDTFLSGARCSFTAPKAGLYRLSLELLGTNHQPIPFPADGGALKISQDMNILVYQQPKPKILVLCDQWQLTPGKADIYTRNVTLRWDSLDSEHPRDYSYSYNRKDIQRRITVHCHVRPMVPVHGLDNISWLSSEYVTFDSGTDVSPTAVITQYFHYDPTTDAPRNLNFYSVKATVSP